MSAHRFGGGTGGGSSTYNAPNCIVLPGTDSTPSSGTPHIEFTNLYGGASVGPRALTNRAALASVWRVDQTSGGVYMVSGSTGAKHPWLNGYNQSGIHLAPGAGNVYRSDDTIIALNGAPVYPVRTSEWHCYARLITQDGSSNTWAHDFINGLKFFTQQIWATGSGWTRSTAPAGSGGGSLWLGHSNHQGGVGRVASFGGWETECPNNASPANQSGFNFIPFRLVPTLWGGLRGNFNACFQQDFASYPDRSGWFNEGSGATVYQHPGIKKNGNDAIIGQFPPPSSVYDAEAAQLYVGGDYSFGTGGYTPTAPGAPSGSPLAWDDWCTRGPQDYFRQAVSGPNIGTTRGGSAGTLTWRQRMAVGRPTTTTVANRGFGIVYLSDGACLKPYEIQPQVCDVNVGTADHMVISDRVSTDGQTAVCARVRNAGTTCDDYLVAFNYLGASKVVIVYDMRGGATSPFATPVAVAPTNLNWTRLMLWCKGTTVRCYVDKPGGVTVTGAPGTWEQVGADYTDSYHNADTYAGLGNEGGANVYGDGIWASRYWVAYGT